jgi:hypothetical protein
MATILGQRCTVFLDEAGIQRFKIDSSVDAVLAGDLPIYGPPPYTSNIFVHKIVAPLDPKSDTFLRVGNVADLTTLSIGRETAVALGQPMYLSTEFTVTYDDIATASSAKVLIQQRVDNLIADWHTYNEKFLAPLSVPPDQSNITLPLTDSIVSERQDAYNEAHAELLVATGEAATAAATTAATITLSTAANETAIGAVAESTNCSLVQGQNQQALTAMNSYRASVTTFMNAMAAYGSATTIFVAAADTYRAIVGDPSAPQEATYDAAKLAYINAKTLFDAATGVMQVAVTTEATLGGPMMSTVTTNIQKSCSDKIQKVQIAAQKKTDADAAAAEATTAQKAADEAASAALIADTQAFLSLQEVCPDAEHIVP